MIATKADYEICRKLHKKHGKSYYFAAKLFPKEKRLATYALYAFFRVPDEMVDNPGGDDPEAIRSTLEDWRGKWRDAYASGNSNDPVLRATLETFKKFDIPYEYSESFLDAMIQDVDVDRYETFEDLCGYMYGSAAVVGLMMSYVIGFSNEAALQHAEELGYAMQLTNFLRDIDEDFVERGRIYLPLEDLRTFGVSEDDIREQKFTPAFDALMQFEIDRARKLYEHSEKGIPMLNKEGRFAVRSASALYAAILDKLEAQGRNVFSGRASTSTFEKFLITFSLWKN